MSRDKDVDPRLAARECMDEGSMAEAQVWALIHQGDAIHRLAKQFESADELAERRRRRGLQDNPPPPELSA